MEIGHNSEGKFVPATNGKVNDAVGYVAAGKGQKNYNVYQTFTVRYAGKNYNLHTEFEHETVVDKNRYINNVVVVQP